MTSNAAIRRRERVVDALHRLPLLHFEGCAVGGRFTTLGQMESYIHEACHWAALGKTDIETCRNSTIGSRLRDATPEDANANEAITVAAEILVMRALRVGWAPRHTARLLTYAFKGLNEECAPRYVAFREGVLAATCTPSVRALAKRVVGWVRDLSAEADS